MVKVNYGGLPDPRRAFDQLGPYRDSLMQLRMKCRPFGTDFLILDAAIKALDTAAYHFTREPDFFAIKVVRNYDTRSGG